MLDQRPRGEGACVPVHEPMHEPMSRRDYCWFRMDGASNLMVINSVLMFEGALDFDTLRATLAQRLPNYARFTQRVSVRRHGLLFKASWVHDPDFEIARHVAFDAAAAPISEAQLHALLSGQALQPLDKARPLWHMQVFKRAAGGFAIVFRLHHCITDGLGLVHVLKHLTDDSMHHDGQASMEWHPAHAKPQGQALLCKRVHRALFWARISAQLARLALLIPDPRSSLKRPLSAEKCLLQLPAMQLELVRGIAKSMQATVNDVWVAAVAGALRAYLQERGEPAAKRSLRAAVTFSLRNKGDAFLLGNHFGLVAVDLPSDKASALERLTLASARMKAIKASHQPHATMFFLSLSGYLPARLQTVLLKLFTAKGSVVLTNVEGPPQPRYLAGSLLQDAICWVPQAGTFGVGFALMSYAGQIQISMFADRSQVADPQRLMDLVGEAFVELEQQTRFSALDLLPRHLAAPSSLAGGDYLVGGVGRVGGLTPHRST
ncbi:WS/DGAT domain-containing protein [Paucibacter sp. B2R-40]|uniref:WS/DGAT domain-containing protein n=1 Tax=Paucibacter sp. B2R-40 TaxID=2893554 RepID=UPI0021E46DFD|nr:WS/DGAT domain-containing protein [Paucibacter sp. B2R-40]MCV2354061.1 WS/DGAT domain-containing protein [Paucibacter sp. B2R-40]